MIGNYSAYNKKEGHFVGEDNKGKFKLVCPECKAEGENLEHKNWYYSKEAGEDLILRCKNCSNETNVDLYELKDWKIRK